MARSGRNTQVVQVDAAKIGRVRFGSVPKTFLEDWTLELSESSPDAAFLNQAALQLRTSDVPVAFPTETVYGLGADATRSSAVRGIYAAKQRPSDNPLIVHVSSLIQLRRLFFPPKDGSQDADIASPDPIPSIYYPLISKFWPGPLTILLPLPSPSPFAPEVTASLPTVAVRMPSSLLALALIHLARIPLAAPSANASTKPSPTTAAHVLHDLSGRIDLILDGGPCEVGVESTVVDGLVNPPVILRPGGVSIEMLKECSGWEGITVGYTDGAEKGVPRAPGMKYKHYSPKAKVVLVEGVLNIDLIKEYRGSGGIGVLATKRWRVDDLQDTRLPSRGTTPTNTKEVQSVDNDFGPANLDAVNQMRIAANTPFPVLVPAPNAELISIDDNQAGVWMIALGSDARTIARNLFSALRELDQQQVGTIVVEAVDDTEDAAAAAVMNRLRKAAEARIKR